MARYSRVALYNKTQNASHNQMNRVRPERLRRHIVEIPEAKKSPDMQETIHQDLGKKDTAVATPIAVGTHEAAQKNETVPSKPAKKLKRKSVSAIKMKKSTAQRKKVSDLKGRKSSAKAATKKRAKKAMSGTSKSKVTRRTVSSKPANKTMMKSSSKKTSSRKPLKKTNTKSSTKRRSVK